MPFFFFLFILLVELINANTIKINSRFSEQNRICIYNSTNQKLKIYLKSKNKEDNQVCLTFRDYSGILEQKCDTQKVTITPDDLREKVIYYVTNLGYQQDDDYFLKIEGDDDGIKASECPTNALAKVSNNAPEDIANAMILAGVITGSIFFAGIVFITFSSIREESDYSF